MKILIVDYYREVLTREDMRVHAAKMGRFFCKKFLNMGPIFHEKNP